MNRLALKSATNTHAMRANPFALLLLSALMLSSVGCGEGGGRAPTPDMGMLEPDAEIPSVCSVRCGPSEACCGESEECVSDVCLPSCAGARCGDAEAVCCAAGELCVGGSECTLPGGPCVDEIDCPDDAFCDAGLGRCLPRSEDAIACTYEPPAEVFDPTLVWSYEAHGSMAMPLVVHLTDDNGDGVIGAGDVPDVVASLFNGDFFDLIPDTVGRLVALSGDDGHLLFESDPDVPLCAVASPAAGDLDADGTPELVAIAADESGRCVFGAQGMRLVAFDHEGQVEWLGSNTSHRGSDAVAIGNLDGDGDAEILAGNVVYSADGRQRWTDERIAGTFAASFAFFSDVDDDPELEVIGSGGVFEHDGSVKWLIPDIDEDDVLNGTVALGWLVRRTSTPEPQVVLVDAHDITVRDARNGELLAELTYEELEGAPGDDAGSPIIADFDGDGHAEVGIAGFAHYAVVDFDGEPSVSWRRVSTDSSSGSVGSTVFDFDGNGSAEVVVTDECQVHILSGRTGESLWSGDASSLTAYEYAVVADVTGDGSANLVVPSYAEHPGEPNGACAHVDGHIGTNGIHVYRDRANNWIQARPVWNQHTYSYDNVSADGSIPETPRQSWASHNTFRLNRFASPETVFLAPDLRVTTLDLNRERCAIGDVGLRARIQNTGSRTAHAGVQVGFYREGSTEERLGSAVLPAALAPGAAAWVEASVRIDALDDDGSVTFFAIVDDAEDGRGVVNECDEDNRSDIARVSCGLI